MRRAFLNFALPDLDQTELEAIAEVLASGWITTGPKTHLFEQEFSQFVDSKFAIAVNSGTAALHLALEAIGLKAGDEVITTTYTFAATAEVIRYFDAKPVLVDINPESLNISPAAVANAITERTRAIIPVHLAGLPVDLDPIHAVANDKGIHVIEDAAHAFPAKYHGKMIGSLSDFTCFSFYATKNLTTAEGGMICTQSEEWAARCRMMALHGISKDAWKRYTAEGSWYYEIIAPGFKYNMTDIAAAMGLAQLKKSVHMWERRSAIAERYNDAFRKIPEIQIPPVTKDCQHAWHLYIIRLKPDQLRIDRAGFIAELKKHQIGASVHFIPLHLHPYYRNRYGYKPEDFPNAFNEYLRVISLPIYSKMTDNDVDSVIEAVTSIVREFKK